MRWIFPRRVNVISYAVLHHILFNVGDQTDKDCLLTWVNGVKSRWSSGSDLQPFAGHSGGPHGVYDRRGPDTRSFVSAIEVEIPRPLTLYYIL